MGLDPHELKAAVEAMIFVSSEPVTEDRLADLFPDEDGETIGAALSALTEEHSADGKGLMLAQVAGGYRITTRPEVHAHVQAFIQRERSERLSMRTLETLSVIAYKQPVTAAEVGEIRGVDPSGTLRTLLDKGLIKVAGRKKIVGRPFVYATTQSFLTTFGLNDLSELPSLKEIDEIAPEVPMPNPGDLEPANDPSDIEPLDATGGEQAGEPS